ncbi:hypothetical protein PN4B1_49340 [Paenibacillus naphthalenovorans]|nr:hypothetical protein PN4B1_49340 [Paenibacillus naphthalenovorans]
MSEATFELRQALRNLNLTEAAQVIEQDPDGRRIQGVDMSSVSRAASTARTEPPRGETTCQAIPMGTFAGDQNVGGVPTRRTAVA